MDASQVLKIRSDRKTLLESPETRQKQAILFQTQEYLTLFETCIESLLEDYTHPYSQNTSLFLRVYRGPKYGLHPMHYPDEPTQALLNQFNVEKPFITLQKRMVERGFFLLDESDASKSPCIHINLWFTKPTHYGESILEHGYNIIVSDSSLKET